MTIVLGILVIAFLLDLASNDGMGVSNIIASFKGKKDENDSIIAFAKELLAEIGSLREDLEYDCDPQEKETITQKINDREKILDKLF
jgi:hypothetical protein